MAMRDEVDFLKVYEKAVQASKSLEPVQRNALLELLKSFRENLVESIYKVGINPIPKHELAVQEAQKFLELHVETALKHPDSSKVLSGKELSSAVIEVSRDISERIAGYLLQEKPVKDKVIKVVHQVSTFMKNLHDHELVELKPAVFR